MLNKSLSVDNLSFCCLHIPFEGISLKAYRILIEQIDQATTSINIQN